KSNGDFTEEGSPTVDAWKRKCDKNLCIDANGTEYPLDKKSGIANNPRYIIEYLSKTTEGRITYRVTAKAWGKNANTQVVLQSYVASE
ncbi:pilus assembly PilX family protein, partial [Neisseria sp. P0006.S006]